MLDADVVAVSPSSVWRALGQAGLRPTTLNRTEKSNVGTNR